MPTPAEPRFEDDASGEAWFQKGVTLLEGRKQEREFEEKLRRMSYHKQQKTGLSISRRLATGVYSVWV